MSLYLSIFVSLIGKVDPTIHSSCDEYLNRSFSFVLSVMAVVASGNT
jgi:hypothetical protein